MKYSLFKNYLFSLILFSSLLIGSGIGFVFGKHAQIVKPLGDIFLNLLFTIVVPLVFFSISSAVSSMTDTRRLSSILRAMMVIFILTGIISSFIMVVGVMVFDPAQGLSVKMELPHDRDLGNIGDRLVSAFTVSDFGELLSRKNMLALILIAMLTGLGTLSAGEKGEAFCNWLISGNEVMMKVIGYIMLYAPIGLGAYFAYLVGIFGPELIGTYGRIMLLYYPLAIFYFFAFFTIYAWLAAGNYGVQIFWSNIAPTALTALGTGSSVASIVPNLDAAKCIGVPEDIREVVIPIGSTIHMDGSCLSAILKIAVLFGLFGMEFHGTVAIATAVGIALLSGIVMSGIPGGGFLGEMLIVSLYGFPPEALPIAAMIGTIVDPPATMINAVGDNVASMLVARIIGGPDWIANNELVDT